MQEDDIKQQATENGEEKLHLEPETQSLLNEENVVDEKQAQIDKLTADNEALLYKMAEIKNEANNISRRANEEVKKAKEFALEKFAGDLIPVIEALEKGIASVDSEKEKEGLEMTLKLFLDILTKYGVQEVAPQQGESFDANMQQAIATVPNPEFTTNTIVEVFQKGYALNGRLLRPAMVVVAQ